LQRLPIARNVEKALLNIISSFIMFMFAYFVVSVWKWIQLTATENWISNLHNSKKYSIQCLQRF